jgi:asparagine synthase (glutamine-hydrolysing)
VSGFAGIVRIEPTSESAEVDRAQIQRMAQAIAFRGPDALQQTLQPGAAFAFSFLMTGPGRQESSQPCSNDGETLFLGDVRCDGREELTRQLSQHGAKIPAEAPSEHLVLKTFSHFGENGLAQLHGDLSLALWIPQRRKLIGFRDLSGARPFFYARRGGVLVFSNTLQAVLASQTVSRELDEEFLADFLLGAPYHNPSVTAYRDIRRLPPGHILEFSETGLSIRRIANMPVEELLVLRNDEEYIEEFKRLLNQAVIDRLPTVDATVLLSGGLDSTSIAAAAVAHRRANRDRYPGALRAFSVDLKPLFDDQESNLASRFAASLGIQCQISHVGDVLPLAGWDEFPALLPEPPLDPYSIQYLSYPRHIALNSRVVFSGAGCDELLRLQALPYLRYLAGQGKPIAAVLGIVGYSLLQRKLPPLGAGIRSGPRRLFRKPVTDHFYPPWFTPDFERRLNIPERWRVMNIPPTSPHPFNPKAYQAFNDLSLGSVLEPFDATWTACHTELRAPFLDRRLVRFLLRIPVVPWAMEKHLLRSSQIGTLPDEIRLRKKTPVLHDALLLHTSSEKFTPTPTNTLANLTTSLVCWPQIITILRQSTDQTLYLHLRPLALAKWLENVEKHGPERYSR